MAWKDLKSKEQTKSIKGIFPESYENVDIKNELNKIKEYEKLIEAIWFIIQARDHLILECLKQ